MDGGEGAETVRSRIEAFAWPQVVTAGVGAFLLGYVVTVAVVYLGPSSTSGSLAGVLAVIAYVFYSAQNVPVAVPDLGSVSWLEFVGQPGPPEPSVPLAVFYLIPFVVVFGTGAWAARTYGSEDGTPVDAVLVSAGFAAGYWLLAVLGTFVFRTRSAFGVQSRLVLTDAALYGLLYPLVASLLAAGLVQFARYLRTGGEPAQA